jgi:hypothetical protein
MILQSRIPTLIILSDNPAFPFSQCVSIESVYAVSVIEFFRHRNMLSEQKSLTPYDYLRRIPSKKNIYSTTKAGKKWLIHLYTQKTDLI